MGLTCNIRVLWSFRGGLKVIEIVLFFIAIALLRHYNLHFGSESLQKLDIQSVMDRLVLGIIAIGSPILISPPLLIGYIFFAHSSDLLEVLFCFTAAFMNVVGGAMAISTYEDVVGGNVVIKILGIGDINFNPSAGMAMGSIMITNAIVYVIDAIAGGIANRNK